MREKQPIREKNYPRSVHVLLTLYTRILNYTGTVIGNVLAVIGSLPTTAIDHLWGGVFH